MKEPALVIFLFLFSLARLVVGNQPSSTDNNDPDCQTPACHELASRLLNDMDSTVNPCNDFYQFTCGGFINTTDLKNSNYLPDSIDSYTVLQDKFLENLGTTLEESSSVNEFKYLKLAKTLYRVCYKNISYTNISNFLEDNGGWPVLKGSQWNESDLNTTGHFNELSYFIHFQLKLFNLKNFSISMVPLPFPLTKQDLADGHNNTKVIEYYNNMIKTAENMGAEKNSKYKDELHKILDFEIELSRRTILAQQQSDPSFDRVEMTLDELTKNYPFIDWQQFIKSSHSNSPHLQYNKSSIFTISNFSYLKELNKSSNSTEIKRLLANYMMWKYVEFKKILDANTRKDCVWDVISKLPVAAATIYVQSYNNNSMMINATNDIIKMYSNIKKNFRRMIEDADWIDNKTKNATTQKLELLQIEVGYIKVLTNTSKIDQFYEDLQLFDNESYSDALKRIANFTYKPHFNIFSVFIGQMFDSQATLFHADGSYNPYSIVVSYLLIPQNNYFHYEGPNYMNYGGLGSTIGHEIVHGFDIDGIYYNGTGDVDYLLRTSFAEDDFHNRSQCIIEQYGNYTMPEVGLNVDGNLTQEETVSDNSGMRASYRAYEELLNNDKKLPGLKYSPKQLFWLSYGNAWCEKISVNYIYSIMNDTHPLAEYRVNGVVSNMPEFSKDFGCPLGSNMNPIKKCTVW